MYEKYYGLKESPFSLTPDPEFLFLTKRSKEALDHILYGIDRREGFAAIVGDVGTGKTTLCWAILERLEGKKVRTALVQNPMLTDTDILRSILQDLGVPRENAAAPPPPEEGKTVQELFDTSWTRRLSRKDLIDRLNAFLAEQVRDDFFTVLIIDEAQNLSLDLLEQLRLLSNLETAKKKLLQIIFVGQLELDEKLKKPELRQLNQRISNRFETKTLSRDETELYIRHRLVVAGGSKGLRFGRGAFNAIHHHSRGYPRLINLICDRALLAAYSQRSMVITPKTVRKAVDTLEGKEDVAFAWPPSRLVRILAFLAFVAVSVAVLSFLIWKWALPKRSLASPVAVFSTPAAGTQQVESPREPNVQGATETPPLASAPAPPTPEAEAAPVPPPEAAAEQTLERKLALQVHSFRTEDEAKAAARALETSGYAAFTRYQVNAYGSGWHVVYVGPFEGMEDAKHSRSALRATGLSPLIRTVVLK
jgi:general secretion pathway protein A